MANQPPRISRDNPSKEEFDAYYGIEDPWQIRGSTAELARNRRIQIEFEHSRFRKGIDIGCGEGTFTGSIGFIDHLTGVDISDVAISRAAKNFPRVTFAQGDMRDLARFGVGAYDFVACLETLYYVSKDADRDQALSQMELLGSAGCVYLFSVVTTGENEHRRYFTLEEAIELLSRRFNIVNTFPIRPMKIPTIDRLSIKLRLKDPVQVMVDLLQRKYQGLANQTAFVAVKRQQL